MGEEIHINVHGHHSTTRIDTTRLVEAHTRLPYTETDIRFDVALDVGLCFRHLSQYWWLRDPPVWSENADYRSLAIFVHRAYWMLSRKARVLLVICVEVVDTPRKSALSA